jgi:hypothetical protein
MGDPSVEVSHDASQEAEGVVMEAILRRYYCFPLYEFGSSYISFSNIRVSVCYFSRNLEEPAIAVLLNLNSAIECFRVMTATSTTASAGRHYCNSGASSGR